MTPGVPDESSEKGVTSTSAARPADPVSIVVGWRSAVAGELVVWAMTFIEPSRGLP